jgi:hypothetical protein
VQPPEGIEVPLAMVKLFAPAVAVTPVQVPLLPVVLIVTPPRKVSVKRLVSEMALAFEFVMVTVSVEVAPDAMVAGANDLLTVGAASTVRVDVDPGPAVGT